MRSMYDGFSYTAILKAPRKGAREVLKGHQWTCDKCHAVVHEEKMISPASDQYDVKAQRRHLRINEAVKGHECGSGRPAGRVVDWGRDDEGEAFEEDEFDNEEEDTDE